MKSSECILNEFDRIRSGEKQQYAHSIGFMHGLAWCFLSGRETLEDISAESIDDLLTEMHEFIDCEREINELICAGRLDDAAKKLQYFASRWPNSPEAIGYERDIKVSGVIAKEFNDVDE